MAIVSNPHLANQKTSTRFGELVFDAQGNCEVDDEKGAAIHAAGYRGWKVHGLPVPEEEAGGDVDSEDLGDELKVEGEGKSEEAKKAPKFPQAKKKK